MQLFAGVRVNIYQSCESKLYMEHFFINPGRAEWKALLMRPSLDNLSLEAKVSGILSDVKLNGDLAVKKYAAQFDGVELGELEVSASEFVEAEVLVSEELKQAISVAKNNIERFHTSQAEPVKQVETMEGVVCWRKSVPVQKVGLYIPGGTAPLFSTLLMLGIPAMIAGCKEIIVCTPCDKQGKVNPVILYVAQLIGLKTIYKIGGVQAIGAMAYGTETIPQVFKIFGPGNQYVTCAKQLVNKEAGPSEVAVYADNSCNSAFVAADLLSQAEHGPDSQVLLVASSVEILDLVKKEIEHQLDQLSRRDFAAAALSNSRFIVLEDVSAAFDLLNEYAAEHLIIAADTAVELSDRVVNAGSIFLGHYSPESVGDYASGTNHTLPTNGYATAYSGVSLDSFFKKITFQQLTQKGLQNIGNAVETMAEAEGLMAHKNAVSVRLQTLSEG